MHKFYVGAAESEYNNLHKIDKLQISSILVIVPIQHFTLTYLTIMKNYRIFVIYSGWRISVV